jgi:hypothetical protein
MHVRHIGLHVLRGLFVRRSKSEIGFFIWHLAHAFIRHSQSAVPFIVAMNGYLKTVTNILNPQPNKTGCANARGATLAGFQNDPGTIAQEAGFGYLGRFWTESFNDGMTAKASGTQANSTLLDSMFCRVSTVTSVNDGVLLPAINNFPGGALVICVTNDAANSMTVFAQGSDTINGIAGATGVIQMGKSVTYYQCTAAGKWQVQGLGSGYSGSNQTYSFQDAMSANSGGVQAGATAITASISRFTTVGGAGYSAVLMPAAAGLDIIVINAGANIMQIFPAGTDQINSLAASSSLALQPGQVVSLVSTATGQWHTLASGGGETPKQSYSAVATVSAAITLTGAQLTGATDEVVIDMTGTQAGGVALTLPTVAQLVTAMVVAGVNPQPGQTFELDIIARDPGAHAYTVTTANGWTLTGTMTVQTQMRRFLVTLTSLSAAVLRSIYTVTVGAA